MRTLTVAVALLGATILSGPVNAADPEVTPDGLHKVEGSRVMLAYARPDRPWQKYRTVQVLPLVIPDSVRSGQPRGEWYEVWSEERLGVADEDAAALQQFYADIFRAELQKSGFIPVETPRADTLVVATEMTDVISNPPGPAGLEPSGSVAIRVCLSDGATRRLVSTMTDRRFAHYLYPENSRETDLEQVRAAFANWTHVISQELRELADKPKTDLWACLNERKNCPPHIALPPR